MAIRINPYLNFKGNTEEAFEFYRSVFGGEFLGGITRFGDTPEGDRVLANERNKVMHMALPIGKDNLLMGTDALESMGHNVTAGTNFHLSIDTGSKEEADSIYEKLSPGGNKTVPMTQQSWGAYFGMVTDRFGISWMVSFDPKVKV